MRNRGSRITRAALAGALLVAGAASLSTQSATAATATIDSVSFAASQPSTYDHATGGGTWAAGDRTTIVNELQATDFACGDWVSYLTELNLSDAPTKTGPYTARIIIEYTVDSTGASGVSLRGSTDASHLRINTGDPANSPATPTAGIAASPAPAIVRTGTEFTSGSFDTLTFVVENLQAGQDVILRSDAQIACQAGERPTGNLQASLESVTVIDPPPAESAGSGAQTVNFKNVSRLTGLEPNPFLELTKTAVAQGGACPGVGELSLTSALDVTYCYTVTNTGNFAAYDVELVDDNATPDDVTDDVTITLAGLSDIGGDPGANDLAAGASATGTLDVTLPGPGRWVNTASATLSNVADAPEPVTAAVNAGPYLSISKARLGSGSVRLGDTIDYQIVVTNRTLNVTVTGVVITDANAVLGACTPAMPAALEPGEALSCRAAHVVTAADVAAGSVQNTATVNADGLSEQASNAVAVPIEVPLPNVGGGLGEQAALAALLVAAGLALSAVRRRPVA